MTLVTSRPAGGLALGLLCALAACGGEPQHARAASPEQVSSCTDFTPTVRSLTLVDANGNTVSSISPNTAYRIKVNTNDPSTCVNLTSGGTFSSGTTSSCLDTGFPTGSTFGSYGTVYYSVVSSSNAACPLAGYLTPIDPCDGSTLLTSQEVNFVLPGGTACGGSGRTYACGYALPGYGCNNGRNHAWVTAPDMSSAIAACHTAQLPGYTDFCYVADYSGIAPTDPTECTGSWRPGSACCNFEGSLSCPASRTFACGYALPGYGCNNGRNHAIVTAADLSSAITACHTAQLPGYTDFCYVIDQTGTSPADPGECSQAGASWRSGNNCCNFEGTLSCP
jgi:hypothetical protein